MDDWNYSGDPASSDLDAVRFHMGDTDETDPQVRDSEINYALTLQSNVMLAAAIMCDHLARRFSRQADKSAGSLSISASQRAQAYRERAKELREDATVGAGAALSEVFVGGLSIAGKEQLDNDSDAVQPSFRRDQFSNPGAGESTEE